MPQAVVAAPWFVPALLGTATAAAGVGSAALQSRASNKATQAQQQANSAALQYEREREAATQARRDKGQAAYQAAMDAWYKRNGDDGIKRYGAPVGWAPPSGAPGQTGRPVKFDGGPAAPPAPQGAQAPQAQRMTLGSLMGSPAPQLTQAPQALGTAAPMNAGAVQPRTLGDLSGWNDWSRYGAAR